MDKYPPPPHTRVGNYASRVVWHTIVFKVSAFHFFYPNLGDVTIWSKILSSIVTTIIVEETLSIHYTVTVGAVFTVHSNYKNERPVVC